MNLIVNPKEDKKYASTVIRGRRIFLICFFFFIIKSHERVKNKNGDWGGGGRFPPLSLFGMGICDLARR